MHELDFLNPRCEPIAVHRVVGAVSMPALTLFVGCGLDSVVVVLD